MKGSLLHNGIMSYGKTFVALTWCLQIQLSTTNLVKDMHTRKEQRKSPWRMAICMHQGACWLYLRGEGYIPPLVRSANQ